MNYSQYLYDPDTIACPPEKKQKKEEYVMVNINSYAMQMIRQYNAYQKKNSIISDPTVKEITTQNKKIKKWDSHNQKVKKL